MKKEEIVKMELESLIEQIVITIGETERIWGNKEMSEFERGRHQGIILLSKDFLDNLVRFSDRIGINLRKPDEVRT